jgi:hypothetical protein
MSRENFEVAVDCQPDQYPHGDGEKEGFVVEAVFRLYFHNNATF